MTTIIDQLYVVIVSLVPGILQGEVYHHNTLISAAAENKLATLSSTKNFFIYNEDGKQKLLTAIAVNKGN
jgi:hypothetical protein